MERIAELKNKLSNIIFITTDYRSLAFSYVSHIDINSLKKLTHWFRNSNMSIYEQKLASGKHKFFAINHRSKVYFIYADITLDYYQLKTELERINFKSEKRSIKKSSVNSTNQKPFSRTEEIGGKWIMDKIKPDIKDFASFFSKHYAVVLNRDGIGGDFIWTKSDDTTILIALFDCNGHGVEGAMTALIFHNIITNIFETLDHFDLNKIISEISEKINKYNLKCANSSETLSADISLCLYDKKANKLKTCVSGITTLVKHENEVDVVKSENQIIPRVRHEEYELTEGDKLLMFSDGLAHQFSGDTGKKVGTKRVVELFKGNYETKEDCILDFYNNWKNKAPQTDDVSIVGLEI